MLSRIKKERGIKMESTVKLTREQVIWLIFASACGNIVYNFTWVVAVVNRPYWLATFIGVLLNIPFVIWTMYLGKYYQGRTIFDILGNTLGKFICSIIIIAYISLNIAIAACMLNMYVSTIKVFFLQYTPPWVLMLFLVAMGAAFAGSGITILGRLLEMLVILFIFNFFSGFFLSFIRVFKIENITPIFDTTLLGFAKGMLITAGNISECLLFLMITAGSIPDPQKHYIWAVKGLTYWAVVLSFAIFIMGGMISPELLMRIAQAGVAVSRIIQIGEFIRGMEVLILITYQLFAIMKVSLCIYSSWVSAQKLLSLRNNKLHLIFVSIAVFSLSIWMNSFNTGYFLSLFLGTYIILPFAIFILLLTTLCIFIKNRNKGSALK